MLKYSLRFFKKFWDLVTSLVLSRQVVDPETMRRLEALDESPSQWATFESMIFRLGTRSRWDMDPFPGVGFTQISQYIPIVVKVLKL